jgi:hypothetical protein
MKLSNKHSLGSLSSYRSNTRYEKKSDEDDDDDNEADEDVNISRTDQP